MLPYVMLLFSNCREVARIVLKTPVQYCKKKKQKTLAPELSTICHIQSVIFSFLPRLCVYACVHTHTHFPPSLFVPVRGITSPLKASSCLHTSSFFPSPLFLLSFPPPSFFSSFSFLSLPCYFIDTCILA